MGLKKTNGEAVKLTSNGILREEASDSDKLVAGTALLPILLVFVSSVLRHLNYKYAFWCLIGSLLFYGQPLIAFIAFLGGFFALVASYRKPLSPFVECHTGLDVLLGRSHIVSRPEPEHLESNNNVSICIYKGMYVITYRKSDIHFPSGQSRLIVETCTGEDLTEWEETWNYHTGNDLREMFLFEMNGMLHLYFFTLIPRNRIFKPIHMFCTTSEDAKVWRKPEQVCRDKEVPWDIKVVEGGKLAYKASYMGDHYGTKEVVVLFEKSRDGMNWEPVGDESVVYRGGICEVAFEFTTRGDLVAIGRNEDGDTTGFGSQLFFAKKEKLGTWLRLEVSLPWRFDSPRMIRTSEGEILLFARYAQARYDLAPTWLEFMKQKSCNLLFYSCLPKSAAIFRIAPPEEWEKAANAEGEVQYSGGVQALKDVQLIRMFEHAFGDTGFFSAVPDLKGGKDDWIVTNYQGTYCHSHAPWIFGQLTRTDVHVSRCRILHL